jgi:DNA-binding LytR/AlgR family response regulator
MRILIVEDEPPIADDIERCTRALLGERVRSIDVVYTLAEARQRLRNRAIDLCLLDLNLSGADGFDLLKQVLAMPQQIIIVSAHAEKAITAFEYGVIDFVAKPFTRERLQKAFDRYLGKGPGSSHMKYLVYRCGSENRLQEIDQIVFFKASRVFVEAYLEDGRKILLEKHLNQLERILPEGFVRVHRSYIVNIGHVGHYLHCGKSRYRLHLKDGTILPISRTRYPALHHLLKE